MPSAAAFFLLLLHLGATSAQFNSNTRTTRKPQASPINDDLKYIACPICNAVVDAIYDKVSGMYELEPKRAAARRISDVRHQRDEYAELLRAVELIVEHTCIADHKYGKWIQELDVRETDTGSLALQKMNETGKCGRECRTIEKACTEYVDGLDANDVTLGDAVFDAVVRGDNREQATESVCQTVGSMPCARQPSAVAFAKYLARRVDEPFQRKTHDERQREEVHVPNATKCSGTCALYTPRLSAYVLNS